MRRSRRGNGSSSEFGSSGEDSFVAVVVTKLTGALLFILLLTMVIMALLPKAVDVDLAEKNRPDSAAIGQPLKIATPTRLPEAITGRSYLVALAATGGRGPLHWTAEGKLPEWLSLDENSGQLAGIPPRETDEPLALGFEVSDGTATDSQPAQLLVLPFQAPSSTAAWLKRHLGVVPWKAWLEQGVGFLVLWLVHLLGMNLLANLERGSLEEGVLLQGGDSAQIVIHKRFAAYRLLVRLTTLSAMIGLAAWLFLATTVRL